MTRDGCGGRPRDRPPCETARFSATLQQWPGASARSSSVSRCASPGRTSAARELRGPTAMAPVAIAALAVGAVAIGRLAIGHATIKHLSIEQLEVKRLKVTELEIAGEPRRAV